MVESEFHFFDVWEIVVAAYAVIFVEALFGVAPKTFDAVDVRLAFAKRFGVLDFVVLAVMLQVLVGLEIIRVKNAAFPRLFLNVLKQSLCRNILHNRGVNAAVPLEDSENRLFVESASAAISFAPSAEIGLVCFDESAQFLEFFFRVIYYRFAEKIVVPGDRVITHAKLSSALACAHLQIKIVQDFELALKLAQTIF